MKYQITCDNCGSKFVVEAEEGATIECKCPNCSGIMEITLPLVSQGQEYIPNHDAYHEEAYVAASEEESPHSNKHLWILAVILVLIAASAGVYFSLSTAEADQPVQPQTTVMDTIPYEQPQAEEPEPVVPDTVETAPQTAPQEEVVPEEDKQDYPTDSIFGEDHLSENHTIN